MNKIQRTAWSILLERLIVLVVGGGVSLLVEGVSPLLVKPVLKIQGPTISDDSNLDDDDAYNDDDEDDESGDAVDNKSIMTTPRRCW